MSDLTLLNITKRKENQFNKKNIYCIEDLINFLPKNYIDCTKETGIIENEFSCIVINVNDIINNDSKKYVMVKGIERLSHKKVNIIWFNQNYLYNNLLRFQNNDFFVCGKITYNNFFKSYSITSPTIYGENNIINKKIYPVYSKISGMSENYLTEKIKTALGIKNYTQEYLPQKLIKSENLISRQEMLYEFHNPTNKEKLKKAKYRRTFEKLLYFATKIEMQNRELPKGTSFCIMTMKKYNDFIKKLPFELTVDQKNVLNEFIAEIKDFRRINSLVCGDVGCGKTVIIQAMSVLFAENGYQAAILCPSVALATQHYNDTKELLSKLGINVCFYRGTSMKAKEKREMLNQIKNGEVQVVIGTHAILSKDVEFQNLAIAMIDEEQKFGVLQEQTLLEKAKNNGVNVAKFSATPIPLTLFKALNSLQLNVKTIKSKPSNRIEPKCGITNKQDEIFRVISREIELGHQAYVVSPMIEESDRISGESVNEISKIFAEHYKNNPNVKIATLTGNDDRKYMNEVLEKFKKNEIQILVASTIIETGINFKNANCLALYGARFLGLSTIHQIRGRILRGGLTPYFMIYSKDINDERLKFLINTTDGFKISEYDLKNRSQGNLIDGYTQHGNDEYVDLMMGNQALFQKIKKIVVDILDNEDISGFLDKKR